MRPSVADVAKYAGVSTATVSRVLNDSPSIRPHTREKVQQAIEALGYKLPGTPGSKVVGTKPVMVLVPDINNPFYSGIVTGIEVAAREKNYSVMLTNTQGESWVELRYLDMLEQNQVCGVISLDPMNEQMKLPGKISKLPWINCSEYVPDSDVAYVSIDHKQAAQDAVLYLVSQGHTKIAMVNSDERYIYARQRREGYEAAMESAGLTIEPGYLQAIGGIDYPLGELAARRLLTLQNPPTAIFAVSDTLAIGVMKAVFRIGKKIPDDVAVIGFDDIPIADMFEPSLTTISQPTFEMGQTAMKMLIQRIEGLDVTSKQINHSLIIRDSA
ncbi:LacI family DNA-binding transcriptional regulator [Vibrio mangrovi]|uniref:HTH-type transcriptional repressor CytR n=1 Tax=Vibrio mangrovi TaxID=474394 RepID=A0A1Y6IN08_9VIBR|nr:LacI family DNA-binding transcriptional regulator [Vibrio mangrovi]MDW6004158.1 LacI family DNA-binding transcriptional regulator [Vibrio mangrovi]SMR99045.1 HTH-type transcriptional repressor CytR [Vibrio mangrovi]